MRTGRPTSLRSLTLIALFVVALIAFCGPVEAVAAWRGEGSGLTCPSCDDLNSCTVDSCDTSTGTCRHDPLDCDDGNPCTLDGCSSYFTGNTLNGGCFHTPQTGTACDDGNSCTVGESCDAGVCGPGTSLAAGASCDDGNSCTVNDTCDADRHCAGDPLPIGNACDDGNACTDGDQCVVGQRPAPLCEGTARSCTDSDLCTQDLCDPATGLCQHPPIDCDDGNDCTSDVCDPATGACRRDNVADFNCSDGDFCTYGDTCVGGNCLPGSASPCDDGIACDSDSCFRMGQCLHSPGSCTCPPPTACTSYYWDTTLLHCVEIRHDGQDCTTPGRCMISRCVMGGCMDVLMIPCDDGNPCTSDTCPGRACTHTLLADGVACTLSDRCTGGGVCSGGVCFGTPLTCNDQNPCTTDACDPAIGCVSTPISNVPCDDGNACTAGETCSQGVCGHPLAVTCDDGNPCTLDGCDVLSGCHHLVQPHPEWCGAGICARSFDHCSTGVWNDGVCIPGAPLAEVCNGLDDDCDGVVDNAPPLAAFATLNVSQGAGGSTDLSWLAVPGASGYGVLRGDLVMLQSMGNLGASLTACLAYDTTAFALSDPTPVEAGQGLFFLLRAMNCTGGTWDEGGTSQVASRDPDIPVTPADCP
jgi:Dictyostelium (slime mold) repeat